MDGFAVYMTEHAINDLDAICDYISFNLLAPESAARTGLKIKDAIASLHYMPERYAVYHEEPWASYKVRFLRVDSYNIFYHVNHADKTVCIIRILYCRQDVQMHLP